MKQISGKLKISVLFVVVLWTVSCQNNNQQRSNGDVEFEENNGVDSVIVDDAPVNPETVQVTEADKLKQEGWVSEDPGNGNMSECYNYSKKFGNLDNYLKVNVGGNTNVVVKVMDNSSDVCVRYVYVNQSTSYTIKNIPEGIYYLKIAYGYGWMTQKENGNCIGKFTRSALYEKGTDILNYNKQNTVDGYSIPSYEISLDVYSSNNQNQFNSANISEDEFNE